MLDPRFFKKTIRDTTLYPNREAVLVEILNSDNSTDEVVIGKAECDLVLFLKCNLKLKESELIKLTKLIKEYGSERWAEGNDNFY